MFAELLKIYSLCLRKYVSAGVAAAGV